MVNSQFRTEMLRCAQYPELHKLVDAFQDIAEHLPSNNEVYRGPESELVKGVNDFLVKTIDDVYVTLLHTFNTLGTQCSQMNIMQVICTVSVTYAAFKLMNHISDSRRAYCEYITILMMLILNASRLIIQTPINAVKYFPRMVTMAYCLVSIAHYNDVPIDAAELRSIIFKTIEALGIPTETLMNELKTACDSLYNNGEIYTSYLPNVSIVQTGLLSFNTCLSVRTNDDAPDASFITPAVTKYEDIGVLFFMLGTLYDVLTNNRLQVHTKHLQEVLKTLTTTVDEKNKEIKKLTEEKDNMIEILEKANTKLSEELGTQSTKLLQ